MPGGRFKDGFADEVRNASSIVAVISSYVPLKKAGTSWKGRCPFHDEKTPSFNVNEDRRLFYCFGCQVGGDVFKFVMLYEKATFPEALRKVASLSGIPLPALERGPEQERRERLFEANEKALEVYRATLRGPRGAAGRGYLEKRGILPETWEGFELGVTPEGWEGVSAPLLRHGFRPEELIAAGLSRERPGGRGLYDRFHERLIFPIRSAGDRVVGFGGRTLSGQDPKYLNSPETELYRKSEVLYGFSLARDAMRERGHAILVEGYLDLIALHQAGFRHTVASLGTSLTERHAELLGRFARKVYLCYDGDAAGRKASRRALPALLAQRLDVAVVEVEGGADPDDLVRNGGPGALQERLERARGFIAFLVGLAREERGEGGEDVASRVKLVNDVLPVLASIPDPVERSLHARSLAEAARIDDQALEEALRHAARERASSVAEPPRAPSGPREAAWSEAEAVLLTALVSDAECARRLCPRFDPGLLAGRPAGRVLEVLFRLLEEGQDISPAALAHALEDSPDQDRLGRLLLSRPPATSDQAEAALITLKQEWLKREIRELQRHIAAALGSGQEGDLDQLLARKQELSRELEGLRRG